MTQQAARNLLRRKKLKGDEVGRALLLSFVLDYQQRDSDVYHPLFTQGELDFMVSLLPSDYERGIYAEYVALHQGLVAQFNQAQGQLQQLQHGLYRLFSRLSTAEKLLQLRERFDALYAGAPDAALLDAVHAVFPEDFQGMVEHPALREEMRTARHHLVLPAFQWLTGYNGMLEIFARALDFPALTTLHIPLSDIRAQGQAYDDLLQSSLARLPGDLTAAVGEACPPLALWRMSPDAELIALYANEIKTKAQGFHRYSPLLLLERLAKAAQEDAHA